jgi:hypothetical protein
LESWGSRLIRLAETPAFVRDREIRLAEARGAAYAIRHLGRAGRLNDLKRWEDRLINLAEVPALTADREIRLEEAKGARDAIITAAPAASLTLSGGATG